MNSDTVAVESIRIRTPKGATVTRRAAIVAYTTPGGRAGSFAVLGGVAYRPAGEDNHGPVWSVWTAKESAK